MEENKADEEVQGAFLDQVLGEGLPETRPRRCGPSTVCVCARACVCVCVCTYLDVCVYHTQAHTHPTLVAMQISKKFSTRKGRKKFSNYLHSPSSNFVLKKEKENRKWNPWL